MAGLVRKTSIQFGNAGAASNFGQFGSKEAGTPQTSQDPAVIQGLPARWQQGWQTAVVSGDKAAYIQDMNGFCFVDSYQLTYIFQMGIPEWDSPTLYFTGSVVLTASTGQQFRSLQGGVPGVGPGQSGNPPPSGASNAFWLWINPPQDLVGTATLNAIPKVTNTAPGIGVSGSVTLSDSAVSDDGTDVILALPLKFADNTIQTTAAVNNAITSRNVFLPGGARALDTTYTNSTVKPVSVSICVACNAGAYSQAYVGTGSPTTFVARSGSSGGMTVTQSQLTFWVLPGESYSAVSGGLSTPTLLVWTEWS